MPEDSLIREQKREYDRARYAVNREQRLQQHEYREANREQLLPRKRAYYEAHRERLLEEKRQVYAERRDQVLDHYGTACACCGATENLSIDHIFGDGAEHRQELFADPAVSGGARFFLWLIQNDFPDDRFQTLCMPCNQSNGNGKHCRLVHDEEANNAG
jgi:hypothetical protein